MPGHVSTKIAYLNYAEYINIYCLLQVVFVGSQHPYIILCSCGFNGIGFALESDVVDVIDIAVLFLPFQFLPESS